MKNNKATYQFPLFSAFWFIVMQALYSTMFSQPSTKGLNPLKPWTIINLSFLMLFLTVSTTQNQPIKGSVEWREAEASGPSKEMWEKSGLALASREEVKDLKLRRPVKARKGQKTDSLLEHPKDFHSHFVFNSVRHGSDSQPIEL